MTAVRFEGCCPHEPGDEAFQIGLDGSVFRGYDVPAWLGSPSGSFNLLIEEIRSGRRMCCPDEFLLMKRPTSQSGSTELAEVLRRGRLFGVTYHNMRGA